MCISLNSCAIYAMCDDYCNDDRICYYCKSPQKRCYCKCKHDLNIRRDNARRYNSTYKPITYRYYTVPVYDPNKPIEPSPKPQIHHHKHHPKPTPHPHCPNNPKYHHNNHNHKHYRR